MHASYRCFSQACKYSAFADILVTNEMKFGFEKVKFLCVNIVLLVQEAIDNSQNLCNPSHCACLDLKLISFGKPMTMVSG